MVMEMINLLYHLLWPVITTQSIFQARSFSFCMFMSSFISNLVMNHICKFLSNVTFFGSKHDHVLYQTPSCNRVTKLLSFLQHCSQLPTLPDWRSRGAIIFVLKTPLIARHIFCLSNMGTRSSSYPTLLVILSNFSIPRNNQREVYQKRAPTDPSVMNTIQKHDELFVDETNKEVVGASVSSRRRSTDTIIDSPYQKFYLSLRPLPNYTVRT